MRLRTIHVNANHYIKHPSSWCETVNETSFCPLLLLHFQSFWMFGNIHLVLENIWTSSFESFHHISTQKIDQSAYCLKELWFGPRLICLRRHVFVNEDSYDSATNILNTIIIYNTANYIIFLDKNKKLILTAKKVPTLD